MMIDGYGFHTDFPLPLPLPLLLLLLHFNPT